MTVLGKRENNREKGKSCHKMKIIMIVMKFSTGSKARYEAVSKSNTLYSLYGTYLVVTSQFFRGQLKGRPHQVSFPDQMERVQRKIIVTNKIGLHTSPGKGREIEGAYLQLIDSRATFV